MKKILFGLTQQEYKLDKDILNQIDFIEIKNVEDDYLKRLLNYKKPISFHLKKFFGNPCMPSQKNFFQISASEKALSTYKQFLPRTLWYSTHIFSSTEKWQAFWAGKHAVAITKPFKRGFLIKRIVKNIKGLKRMLKKELILENMDYNSYQAAKGLYEYICEPDFIKEVLSKTGCRFLLDIGHAIVSAKNLGYSSPQEYLKQLPLEKVAEIHLSRPRVYKHIAKDKHLPVSLNEIKLAFFLKKRLRSLKAVNLEVFRDKSIIIKQLKLIKKELIDKF